MVSRESTNGRSDAFGYGKLKSEFGLNRSITDVGEQEFSEHGRSFRRAPPVSALALTVFRCGKDNGPL